MNSLYDQPFQIPVNNWGFPHFLRTGELRPNDNWRGITGDLGTKLYWLLESLSFKLEYKIGDINFRREYTMKMPLKPHERCCKVPLIQRNEPVGDDWYSTLSQCVFSPVMRLEKEFGHIKNIHYAKEVPLFATRFAYDERDTYEAYTITTHLSDVRKRIVDQQRITFQGSYFDLYLLSDVPDLIGEILSAEVSANYFLC